MANNMNIMSNAASIGSTGASMGRNAIDKTTGALAFEAQIRELKAVGAEATARSMELRTVTTQLTTIKKAADERVQ
ncbi:nodulation protein NopA [Mesorhizobium carmichaelinearum]|uniref:nodulation protein NopA n=1 Tax=Mesorhizobium carmichaelinearum TaxID=1208188 RepID=UPI0015C7B416|nr:nodulation protein NopA [Mesorhizobium carmichaelinearum]